MAQTLRRQFFTAHPENLRVAKMDIYKYITGYMQQYNGGDPEILRSQLSGITSSTTARMIAKPRACTSNDRETIYALICFVSFVDALSNAFYPEDLVNISSNYEQFSPSFSLH